ncbi:hypothetical protein SLE2022_067200 [Rubroshorea leprosula]
MWTGRKRGGRNVLLCATVQTLGHNAENKTILTFTKHTMSKAAILAKTGEFRGVQGSTFPRTRWSVFLVWRRNLVTSTDNSCVLALWNALLVSLIKSMALMKVDPVFCEEDHEAGMEWLVLTREDR